MPAPLQISRFAQFHLGTLLWSIAGLAVLFGVLRHISPGGMLALAMFVLLAVAHVVGNALGTRLRDQNAEDGSNDSPRFGRAPAIARPTFLHPPHPPTLRPQLPVARLRERSPLGRMIGLVVLLSAAFGGTLGGMVLGQMAHVSLSGWAVGTCSSALLGGFIGFMLASFLEMSFRAWWQATQNGSTLPCEPSSLQARSASE